MRTGNEDESDQPEGASNARLRRRRPTLAPGRDPVRGGVLSRRGIFRTGSGSATRRPSSSSTSPTDGPTTRTPEGAGGWTAGRGHATPARCGAAQRCRSSTRPVPGGRTAAIRRSSPRPTGSPEFRPWDERACRIDERVAPHPGDLILEKENASAFFGTHLAPYLIGHGVDTLLITGCSTSACIHATATDAKSYRFRPIIVRECVGDRSPVAHEWTLFDIQARFADVVPLDEVLRPIRFGFHLIDLSGESVPPIMMSESP